jgi:hypothetical protein
MDVHTHFPVIAFSKVRNLRGDGWKEDFFAYPSWDVIHLANGEELKWNERTGTVFIDNDNQSWVVRQVESVGYRTPAWKRFVAKYLYRDRRFVVHEIACEMEATGPVAFSDVQDRVCRLIEQNSDDWIDDEAMAGESGPQVTLETILNYAKDCARRATTVHELLANISEAWDHKWGEP